MSHDRSKRMVFPCLCDGACCSGDKLKYKGEMSMGIYLPNMEMPGMGFREIRIHPNGTATECLEGYEVNVGKAVHVPPHGRLIDKDAIRKKCERGEYPNVYIDTKDIAAEFYAAPTIIEEER